MNIHKNARTRHSRAGMVRFMRALDSGQFKPSGVDAFVKREKSIDVRDHGFLFR
jgi:hypothetical protein